METKIAELEDTIKEKTAEAKALLESNGTLTLTLEEKTAEAKALLESKDK